MTQFNSANGTLLNSNKTIYEVVMIAGANGSLQSSGSTVVSANTGGNSLTEALAAGATWTGVWEDVEAYDSVVVAVKTSANGSFSVQFSPDGVNQDSTLTRYYRTDQIEAPHRFTITRKYARVSFTNSSTINQSYIRLQTMFGTKGDLNAPTDSVLAQDFDATVVRPTDFHYEVALNRRQGMTTWNKWGTNSDVDNPGTETIWSPGGLFVPMPLANNLSVVSTSVNDGGGTQLGAKSVVIWGVDQNRNQVVEVLALTGTAAVLTSNKFFGVNRASIYLCGNTQVNIGNINMTDQSAGGTIQGQIPANKGSTQQLIFFTANNHQALVDWFFINAVKIGSQSPVVTIKGWVTSFVSNAKYEVLNISIDTAIDNNVELNPSQPFVIGENSVFELRANTSLDNTAVSARVSLIEIRDVNA